MQPPNAAAMQPSQPGGANQIALATAVAVDCPACGGKGWMWRGKHRTSCMDCRSTGKILARAGNAVQSSPAVQPDGYRTK